jgi:hypothetical protein
MIRTCYAISSILLVLVTAACTGDVPTSEPRIQPEDASRIHHMRELLRDGFPRPFIDNPVGPDTDTVPMWPRQHA